MKALTKNNINTREYWDTHQTALDFGLRQQKYLSLAGSGDKIVELGCGLSPMLAYAAHFNKAYGVDYSQKTIEQAQRLYPEIEYICSDVTDTPFPDEHFDAVIAGEVIEHLEHPNRLLNEMERICKKGGKIILSTPHLEFIDPEHLWEFEVSDFTNWGFETEIVASQRFNGRIYLFAWKQK